MTCETVSDLILLYPGTRLSPANRGLVVAHTASCPRCRAELVATLCAARQVRGQMALLPQAPAPWLETLPLQIAALPQEAPPAGRRTAGDSAHTATDREQLTPNIGLHVLKLILPAVATLVENPLASLPVAATTWLPDQA